jgi:Arm DNA-binding domain
MVQKIQRLTALAVSRVSKPGMYADGGGLYLRVGRNGSKRWAFRFMLNSRQHEMGFRGLNKVSLADARKRASDGRLLLSEGRNPLVHKQDLETQRIAAEKLSAARSMTFDKCAEVYISAHEVGWKNEKHRQQWRNTLTTYVSPVFGLIPVQHVETDHVLKVLEPIWNKKTETARRLRGRIEVILDWAKVRGFRGGENPARWRGHFGLHPVLLTPA